MKFKIILIIFLLTCSFTSASIINETKVIEGILKDYFSDIENIVIVKGSYMSKSENAILSLFQIKYPEINDIHTVSDTKFNSLDTDSQTKVLIGGPNQNSITGFLLNQPNITIEDNNQSLWKLSKIITQENQEYIVFSDYAGYSNIPKTSINKSPLAKFVPVAYVPVAATGISLGFIWLWELIVKIIGKVSKKKLSKKVLKFIKKGKTIKDKGKKALGIRFKSKEWIAIVFAAVLFSISISYTYLMSIDAFNFIIINAFVNIIIYSIRNLIRLFLDKYYKLHTEYQIWPWGAFITLVSGWLGNTFSLAGFIISEEKSDKEGKVYYLTNLLTIIVAFVFFVWNLIRPNIVIQMSMVMALSVGFLKMLPIKIFGGHKIYKWNKKLWWITFLPILVLYTTVNLIL